jgi:type II secretory pathway component PulK
MKHATAMRQQAEQRREQAAPRALQRGWIPAGCLAWASVDIRRWRTRGARGISWDPGGLALARAPRH